MATKYQTFRLTLPSGSAASIYPFREPLLADMENAIGYVAYENKNTGNHKYRLRVQDDTEVYQQMTNAQDYQAGPNVPKDKRYSPIVIPAKSNQVTVSIQTLEVLTADLDIDFVFMLEKK